MPAIFIQQPSTRTAVLGGGRPKAMIGDDDDGLDRHDDGRPTTMLDKPHHHHADVHAEHQADCGDEDGNDANYNERHVSFAETIHIKHVLHMNDYTDDELFDSFYDRQDYIDFQDNVHDTVADMLVLSDDHADVLSVAEHGDDDFDYEEEEEEDLDGNNNNSINNRDDCLRGCELGIPSFLEHRRRTIRDARNAIQREHDRQDCEYHDQLLRQQQEQQQQQQAKSLFSWYSSNKTTKDEELNSSSSSSLSSSAAQHNVDNNDDDANNECPPSSYDWSRFRSVYQWFTVSSAAKAHRIGLADEREIQEYLDDVREEMIMLMNELDRLNNQQQQQHRLSNQSSFSCHSNASTSSLWANESASSCFLGSEYYY